MAISVVTAEQLDEQRLVSLYDIGLAVPNCVFTRVTRQGTRATVPLKAMSSPQ